MIGPLKIHVRKTQSKINHELLPKMRIKLISWSCHILALNNKKKRTNI